MKNNRKNRRLLHIREKNRVRKGGCLVATHKISNTILYGETFSHDDGLVKKVKEVLKTYIKSKFNKKFKTNYDFEIYYCDIGLDGDDFIKGLKTILIKVKKI